LSDIFLPQPSYFYFNEHHLSDKESSLFIHNNFDLKRIKEWIASLKIQSPRAYNDQYYQFIDYDCQIFNFYMNKIENNNNNNDTDNFLIKDEFKQELSNLYKIIEENWNQHILNKCKFARLNLVFFDHESKKYIECKRINFDEYICDSIYFKKLKTKNWILTESNKFFASKNNFVFESNTIIQLEKPFNVYLKEQVFLRYFLISYYLLL
jgi:hypothetical protein